jgi:hypothetical protein
LLSVNVANLLQRISFLWLLRSLCCCWKNMKKYFVQLWQS